MADSASFRPNQRVRIGKCHGTVVRTHLQVGVVLDGWNEPGWFDPKFVEHAESSSDAPNRTATLKPGDPAEPREGVGRFVRQVWVEWAREQPDPKPSWLLPWEELDDGQREVDMRIGAALFEAGTRSVAPVVDTDLRDRIAEVARYASGTTTGSQSYAPIYWDDVAAEIYGQVVAPELEEARKYTETTRYHQQQHAEAYRELVKVRAELAALKAKRVWRTAPISGVMHLVPRGDGRRESVCGLTASTTWRDAIDGNAGCLECMRWQPNTEATEQPEPKKRAETTCASGPTAENPATTPRGVTPAPTTSPREPWRTTTGAATALATQSPTDPTEHAAATPTEPRVCGQDEGCTGISCDLVEQHPDEHEGTATAQQADYVGYSLTVRWPRMSYDHCEPPLSEVVEDGAT